MTNKLRYYGTENEVLLADRVEYTTILLRRKRLGTVVCISAKTALQLNAEKKNPEDWLLKYDDGTYTGWMFHPEELQPSQRLRLVSRNAECEPITNEELDRRDAEDNYDSIQNIMRPKQDAMSRHIVRRFFTPERTDIYLC